MKKLLSLILALAMVFSLAACGNSNDKPAGNSDAPAPSGDVAADPNAGAEVDPLVIKMSCAYAPSSDVGKQVAFFQDTLTSLSGGKITFDYYHSGTLGTAAEEAEFAMEGMVDMILLVPFTTATILPLFCTNVLGYRDGRTAYEMAYDELFVNEKSSAIMQQSLEDHSLHALPFIAVQGTTGYCTTVPDVTSIDQLVNTRYGTPSAASAVVLGFQNIIDVQNADWYESMRTGLIDTCSPTMDAFVNNRMYEVSKSLLQLWNASACYYMMCNLDFWNGLTAAQQELIEEACRQTQEYSIKAAEETEANVVKICEENGVSFTKMSEEEGTRCYVLAMRHNWTSMIDGLGGLTGESRNIAICAEAQMEWLKANENVDMGSIEELMPEGMVKDW